MHEDCRSQPGSEWRRSLTSRATLNCSGEAWRLQVAATKKAYDDAQLDDYGGLRRRGYPWRPPVRLCVRARFSHPQSELHGTAGFGFWNNPAPGAGRLPALPRAIWFFFASPPSNMALDVDVNGWGWKAMTINAIRPGFLALAPLLPLTVPFMHAPGLRRRLWPLAQRAMGVREALADVDMTAWHEYELIWGAERSRFVVDGQVLLNRAPSPRGPLGLVMWIDNQYAVVTPWGRLGHGYLDTPQPQWMELSEIVVEQLRGDSA